MQSMRDRVLKYFDHVATRNGGNLEKAIITGKVPGVRGRGRSPTRWTDCVKARTGTMKTAMQMAQDRSHWREISK